MPPVAPNSSQGCLDFIEILEREVLPQLSPQCQRPCLGRAMATVWKWSPLVGGMASKIFKIFKGLAFLWFLTVSDLLIIWHIVKYGHHSGCQVEVAHPCSSRNGISSRRGVWGISLWFRWEIHSKWALKWDFPASLKAFDPSPTFFFSRWLANTAGYGGELFPQCSGDDPTFQGVL